MGNRVPICPSLIETLGDGLNRSLYSNKALKLVTFARHSFFALFFLNNSLCCFKKSPDLAPYFRVNTAGFGFSSFPFSGIFDPFSTF